MTFRTAPMQAVLALPAAFAAQAQSYAILSWSGMRVAMLWRRSGWTVMARL